MTAEQTLTGREIAQCGPTVNNVRDLLGAGGVVIVPAVRNDCIEGIRVGCCRNSDEVCLQTPAVRSCSLIACQSRRLTMIMSIDTSLVKSSPVAGAIPPRARIPDEELRSIVRLKMGSIFPCSTNEVKNGEY